MITYRPLSKISAITFDLDDTLYDNMPYIYAAERCLTGYIDDHYPLAKEITQQQWRAFRQQVINKRPELTNDIGLLRRIVLTQGFLSVKMTSKQAADAADDCFSYFYFKRSDFTLPQSIHDLLKTLSNKVPIAAITNGNVNCEAIGLKQYFSVIVQASPQYQMKPHPSMFQQTCKALALPAQTILHVGDDLEKDVKGALRAGYQTAWYAINREMHLGNEAVEVLPHIQLQNLQQLTSLI